MKVNKELAEKIFEDRKNGTSYNDLVRKYGISKWWCTAHLKNIKVEKSFAEEKWKKAEKEAEGILKKMGFSHILNLNLVCANPPHWDYYAEKDGEKWLFDVTINQSKNLVEKGMRMIEGFKSAVLLKDKKWKLLKIIVEEIKI